MSIIKFLILSFLVVLNFSCSNERAKADLSKGVSAPNQTFYPSGKLQIDCNEQKGSKTIKCKEYYETGGLKAEFDWLNGKKDGVTIYYYPNGKKEQEIHWKAGKKNGREIFYQENGKIDIEGEYLMGKPIGWFKEYDKEGLLKTKYEYVSHSEATDGKTINQHISYDKAGNIISEESHYLVYSNVPDTLSIGKDYNLKIKLINPHYESKMRLVKVCGEEGFVAGDSTKYKILEAKNFEVPYNFTANKHGNFNLCGTIHDYKVSYSLGDTIRDEVFRTILFEKKFWVK